jgi:hypothetical protein
MKLISNSSRSETAAEHVATEDIDIARAKSKTEGPFNREKHATRKQSDIRRVLGDLELRTSETVRYASMVTTPAPPAPRRNSSSRLLTPLAPVFYILNWMALVGWSYVLYRVLSYYYSLLHHHQNSHHHEVVDERATTATVHQFLLLLLLQETKSILVLLEGICVVEVGRIFLKDLPGNLTCK